MPKHNPSRPSLSSSLLGHAQNIFLVIVQEASLTFAKGPNVDTGINIDIHLISDGRAVPAPGLRARGLDFPEWALAKNTLFSLGKHSNLLGK